MNTTKHAIHNGPPRNLGTLAADVIALSHIFNGVGSACGAAIAFLVTARYQGIPVNVMAFVGAALATLFLSNGGFIVNDILDIEIDRVNRPDRPLPAGRVSISLAWALYIGYTGAGLLLSWAINPATGILGLITATGLLLYSSALKKRFVIGHVMVALMGALLFPYGGVAAGSILPMLYTMPVVFSAFFAREVLKTVPDAEGDKAHGVINLTTRFGPRVATRISQIMFAICALVLPLLRLAWPLNVWFLGAVVVVIWPLMAFFLWQLTRPPDSENRNIKTVLRLSKLLFLLVALVILIGSL